MSAQLHLAKPDAIAPLLTLVARFHEEYGLETTEEHRRAALEPLLEGSPHGAVYLIGPARAPVGYLVVTFGWSVEFGGLDGFVDEVFVRPSVRGRGIGTEALLALGRALTGTGLRALHLEVDRSDEAKHRLYRKAGFRLRERYALMTRVF